METFSALLALCAGNSPVPVNSPHKGQWRGALMFSLICAWISVWVNNREDCDWRHHRGHYDVNVMNIDLLTWTTKGWKKSMWLALCLLWFYIDGLVQERRNPSALAMEFRLPCTSPSILSISITRNGHCLAVFYLMLRVHNVVMHA